MWKSLNLWLQLLGISPMICIDLRSKVVMRVEEMESRFFVVEFGMFQKFVYAASFEYCNLILEKFVLISVNLVEKKAVLKLMMIVF